MADLIELIMHDAGDGTMRSFGQSQSAPDYNLLFSASFSGGVAGESPTPQMSSPNSKTIYSNDIAGPFGDTVCCKVTAEVDESFFGGTFFTSAAGISLAAGDVFRVRLYHYFPAAFCAGGSTDGPEGASSHKKWLRFQWGPNGSGSRLTMQPGGFASGSCALAASGPSYGGMTLEGFGGTASNHYVDDETVIPRDEWVAIQWSVYLHETNGYIRMWAGETFIGEITGINTLPDAVGSGLLEYLVLGDYWNGQPHETTSWYIDDLLLTKETPNTVDAGGRPYIAPSVRASHF